MQLTRKRQLKIWWAITWRQVLFTVVVGWLIGIIFGFIMGFMGFEYDTIVIVTNIIALPVMLLVSFIAVSMVLKKDFKEFKITLTKE